jgi:hypothetical protein
MILFKVCRILFACTSFHNVIVLEEVDSVDQVLLEEVMEVVEVVGSAVVPVVVGSAVVPVVVGSAVVHVDPVEIRRLSLKYDQSRGLRLRYIPRVKDGKG